ncbi:MAG: alpha/beta hydrolase [Bryobacteraceae bacterium]
MLRHLALVLSACALLSAADPAVEMLWPNGAPGAVGKEPGDQPNLTVYPPKVRPAGVAVIVCPGGGYRGLAVDKEGTQIALWLNSLGVSAFVLQYRIAPRYHHPAPLQDAQRAIRFVRANAQKYGIAADQIGIMGFSAGGHLASSAATLFDAGAADAPDQMDRLSSRPDFAILMYPVITFTEEAYVHKGSRTSLLGENPDPALAERMSTERQVTAKTPPVFLFHTTTDAVVPSENSALFYLAARKAGVPAELHIYEQGPHGVGLASTSFALSSWPSRLADWLRVRGLLH